jgi:hypothetical protein
MSLSNIMSNTDHAPPAPSAYTPLPAQESRRSPKTSNNHIMPKQDHITSPVPPHTPLHVQNSIDDIPQTALQPLPNGNKDITSDTIALVQATLARPRPDEKEVESEIAKIDVANVVDIDPQRQEEWKENYRQRSIKRANDVEAAEEGKRKVSPPLPINDNSMY